MITLDPNPVAGEYVEGKEQHFFEVEEACGEWGLSSGEYPLRVAYATYNIPQFMNQARFLHLLLSIYPSKIQPFCFSYIFFFSYFFFFFGF